MRKTKLRGPVAYVAGPLVFAAALALESASFPAMARAMDAAPIRPAAERRARLVHTFEKEPARRGAEEASRTVINRSAEHRARSLWAELLALALSAVALARGASLRLGRAARGIR
jgi:hypothetical protein